MGKGKRSRENKAVETVNAATAPEKKSSVNIWTNVMLAVVAVILVASIALSVVLSSGIMLRSADAFKSENYEINGAMMQYLFQTQYNNFYNTYYSYMSYFTLDTSKDLRDQQFKSSTSSGIQEALLGDFEGTWFDYFWDLTEKQARQTLVYCEAAKAMGLELTDEDKDNIKSVLDNYDSDAALYQFPTTKSYLNAMFGKGITKSDIRNMLTLSELAAKYYEQESGRILDEIKDEDVKKYFEENKSDYLKADYYLFTFDASLEAKDSKNPSAEELEKFQADIEKAKEHANAIAGFTTVDEIKEYMINYWCEDYYESYYTTSVSDLKKNDSTTGKPTITDADLPTDDAVKAENKAAVIAAVKDAIANEKKVDELEAMGDTAFDKVLDSVRNKLINQINTKLGSMLTEAASYSDSNDEVVWVFEEGRKAGDTKVFNSDDKKSEDAEADEAEEATTFSTNVYHIVKPAYIQEDTTRNFGHILISAESFMEEHTHEEGEEHSEEEDAEADTKAKAEADRILDEFLKGELTKEAFEALAAGKNEDGNEFYDDVKKGEMVTEIDSWIYSDERKENDTKVIKTDYGYHVTWFRGEGNQVWFVDSKDDYYEETVEKWVEELEANTSITFNESIKDKIAK